MQAFLTSILLPIELFLISILPVSSFTEGVTLQPKSFLPHQATNSNEKTVSSLIYRGLFKYDIYGTIVPDLAETWKTSADGISYTVTIKKGQKWSDGTPILAEQFKLSLERAKRAYSNDLKALFDGIDSICFDTVRFSWMRRFSQL